MKQWTEQSALKALKNASVIPNSKFIQAKGSLQGLNECSAVDFLTNHCGYSFLSAF